MKKYRVLIVCVLALCLTLGAAAPASAHHGSCRSVHDCIPNIFEIVRATIADFGIYNIPATAQPADNAVLATVCAAVDAEHCPDPVTCTTHSACHTASYGDCPDRESCATHSTCVAGGYADCLHHSDCPVHSVCTATSRATCEHPDDCSIHCATTSTNSTTSHHSGHHGGHH